MSDTQKNWRKYWENYNPSRGEQIYNHMQPQNDNSNFNGKIIYIAIAVICILVFVSIKNAKKEYIHNVNNEVTENETTVISNKNGKAMADNIKKINSISKEVSINMEQYTQRQLDEYIKQIKEADLSNDYNKYKIAVIKKLELAKLINNAQTTDEKNTIIHQYNDIDIFDELEKAFKTAGVEYTRTENNIHYNYKDY